MKFLRVSTTAFLTTISLVAAGGTAQQPLKGESEHSVSFSEALLDLHKNLVQLPSVSGTEHGVSHWLANYLEKLGYTVELQDINNHGRQNVLAYLGRNSTTRTLVTSHIDTVPPFFPYSRRGDEIWGRGSTDAKASVASQIIAVEELRRAKAISEDGGDVALLFVVGEEEGGYGMKAANDLGLAWESVIFGEPTELKLASGHKGGTAFVLSAEGKSGHSGYPELGRNAIDVLVQGLTAFSQVKLPGSEEFGNTTANVGFIRGGAAANVIPPSANATVLIRVATEDLDEIRKRVNDAVLKVSPYLTIEWSTYGRPPVRIDHDIDGTCFHSWRGMAMLTKSTDRV